MIGRAGCDKMDFNDLVSCTSLGGINIRMLFLGLVIQAATTAGLCSSVG
jgi:hypothetical protein